MGGTTHERHPLDRRRLRNMGACGGALMTRLFAGWAPGTALQFGWELGVTAAHSDLLDYRAMLARTIATKNGNANGYSHVPESFVAWELSQPELWREFFERDYSGELA